MTKAGAAQKQLRAIARDLGDIRYRLLGVIASLSEGGSGEPGDDEEDGKRSDRVTVVRSAAECVLADNIRPAIDDLLTAARYRGRKGKARRDEPPPE
jgi:hypothetical protein